MGLFPDNFQCSEGKLHQAFLNIMANAVQAIEKKGTINISTPAGQEEIKITIEDSGSGIREEDLPKIFDPFFTTKDPGKFTGLGLSITYNIINEHKGTLETDSKYRKGTSVIVGLPIILCEF